MEKYRPGLLKATLISGAGILTLAACGDQSGGAPEPNLDGSEPTISAEYYTNGNRILRYSDDGGLFADVIQSCDGQDLIEQTEFLKYGYGAAGNSFSRTVGHTACLDGKLTPEDFQPER